MYEPKASSNQTSGPVEDPRRAASPAAPGPDPLLNARFWSKVDVGVPNECWEWLASRNASGYGRFGDTSVKSGWVRAHRKAYELSVGPIPDGMVIDHLCRNRGCVNPEHLEVVTQRENNRRGEGWSGRHAQQAACVNGHEFTPENTYTDPRERRNCRACHRDRELQRYRELKAYQKKCESCRREPASVWVDFPEDGTRVAVCAGCAIPPAIPDWLKADA